MRIIAGRFKGRTLRGPDGPGVRPTSDGLRETLFNVLRDRVEGATVLDAYAGTGSVGLEALSRGAVRTIFIEREARSLRVLEGNIRALGAEAETQIIRGDVLALGRHGADLAADVVFADPPYDVPDLDLVVNTLARHVAPGGLLILEYSRRRETPLSAGILPRTRVLVSGDSALAFYTSPAAF
jgi:16S rRNA (guanine966-N2)-methyltransferase